METMNYNRDNKKNKKTGIIAFMLFVCIGCVSVIYMIANEPEANVIGQDYYVPVSTGKVDVYNENETDQIDVSNITYSVKENSSKVTSGKFKSNITVPRISIDSVDLTDINNAILNKFNERYEIVKKQAKDLENNFTYKVTYKQYESKVEGTRILTFTFHERIIDDAKGTETMYKLYAYNINLATKEIMSQDDAASLILGSTCKTLMRNQVKSFVVDSKMISESKYTYSITGMEEFYVKNGQFHMIFNSGDLVDARYEHLDITITK